MVSFNKSVSVDLFWPPTPQDDIYFILWALYIQRKLEIYHYRTLKERMSMYRISAGYVRPQFRPVIDLADL